MHPPIWPRLSVLRPCIIHHSAIARYPSLHLFTHHLPIQQPAFSPPSTIHHPSSITHPPTHVHIHPVSIDPPTILPPSPRKLPSACDRPSHCPSSLEPHVKGQAATMESLVCGVCLTRACAIGGRSNAMSVGHSGSCSSTLLLCSGA